VLAAVTVVTTNGVLDTVKMPVTLSTRMRLSVIYRVAVPLWCDRYGVGVGVGHAEEVQRGLERHMDFM
jgi:hypothetical protein